MDHFSEELKKVCTLLKLLVAEISVLYGLLEKEKNNDAARHFFKAIVEKKANKHPGFELFEMLLSHVNSRFVGYINFLSLIC